MFKYNCYCKSSSFDKKNKCYVCQLANNDEEECKIKYERCYLCDIRVENSSDIFGNHRLKQDVVKVHKNKWVKGFVVEYSNNEYLFYAYRRFGELMTAPDHFINYPDIFMCKNKVIVNTLKLKILFKLLNCYRAVLRFLWI